MKLLHEVLETLSITFADDPLLNLQVSHLSANSRQVQAGEVFLALKGLSGDGVLHAVQAKAQGAYVIAHRIAEGVDWVVPDLADRLVDLLNWFYDDPSAHLKLIGITGTNGKTSTSHYLAQFLAEGWGKKVAVIGTVGNGIWGELTESTHTTPDVVSLYRQLAQWRDQQVEYVVMEVSSHAIAQKRIAGLKFEIVALTQVTRDHLDFHASEAEYREVKAHFLSDTPTRYRVINTSDAVGQAVASQASCVGYGYQLSDFARIYSIETEAEGMYVHLAIGDASWQAWVHLYGQFNIENVLCAATCASLLGYGFDQSGYQLRSLKPVAGRMQKVRSEPVVIVDYAHTPDALEKVLQAVREHCVRGKLWVVFGAGGDRDVGKRPLMGQVAERLADHIILTDDNPRSEMAQAIVSDILLGMNAPERAIYIANRAEAIANALKRAEPHDLVLIAGKGHETYQEIAGKRFPFSDIEAVQKCLP